ncbi:AAA family ATPase [Shewanella sp. KJ10-1]|uniref:AAA family ATPase n=1 Tax=Shewanella phaeophyticola TaxID=2978345 RepID=A0ABT2P2A0_9GAMM|nr:AAA family ATPase [Shewanella sp. KJ10-1]MCT8986044.1 AAA family ATPase [Shewanella sp. KJ10-1]
MLLADEINRASPKTQSALLEAMAEQQITIDGITHHLSSPFFVIATQNPLDQAGTFPLPESQLDRFMMRISIGYPNHEAELAMLKTHTQATKQAAQAQCITPQELLLLQQQVAQVSASDAVLNYLIALVDYSRQHDVASGLSPRVQYCTVASCKSMGVYSPAPICSTRRHSSGICFSCRASHSQ